MAILYIKNENDEFVEIPSIRGLPGKSSYLHIKYGTSSTPEVLLDEPNAYIGIIVTDTEDAPNSYLSYKWSLIGGYTGSGSGEDDYVNLTGNQTINGIKTFTGQILVPTPLSDNHAATKSYVDSHTGGITSSTITNIWTGTQAEYDALMPPPSSTTLCFITG